MIAEQDRVALCPELREAIQRAHNSLAFTAILGSTAVAVAALFASTVVIIMAN